MRLKANPILIQYLLQCLSVVISDENGTRRQCRGNEFYDVEVYRHGKLIRCDITVFEHDELMPGSIPDDDNILVPGSKAFKEYQGTRRKSK